MSLVSSPSITMCLSKFMNFIMYRLLCDQLVVVGGVRSVIVEWWVESDVLLWWVESEVLVWYGRWSHR